jgi:hypothetical protein
MQEVLFIANDVQMQGKSRVPGLFSLTPIRLYDLVYTIMSFRCLTSSSLRHLRSQHVCGRHYDRGRVRRVMRGSKSQLDC